MYEKVEKLSEVYSGKELEEKLVLLSRVYQRMKKHNLDPEKNFFLNYQDKYNM